MATQFGHIGPHFKCLLELGHGTFKATLALKDDPQAHMGRNILRIGCKHLAEGLLGLIKLATGQVGFPENALGLQVFGKLSKHMLRYPDRQLDLIGLKVATGLIIRGLQAHGRHTDASYCPIKPIGATAMIKLIMSKWLTGAGMGWDGEGQVRADWAYHKHMSYGHDDPG